MWSGPHKGQGTAQGHPVNSGKRTSTQDPQDPQTQTLPWPLQQPLGDREPSPEGQSSLSAGGPHEGLEARPIWKAQIHLHPHKPRKGGKLVFITGTEWSNSASGDGNENSYNYQSQPLLHTCCMCLNCSNAVFINPQVHNGTKR